MFARPLVASLCVLAALASSPGCKNTPPPPAEPAQKREHPLVADGTTERQITMLPDKVKVQTDLAYVRAAVRTYRAEKDAFPPSLDELSLSGLNYPKDLSYDPATGEVKSQTYGDY